MKLSEEIRQQAKADSRRFARGVHCRIIYESEMLNLISRWTLKPVNIIFDTGVPAKWYAQPSCHFLAIPLNALDRYQVIRKQTKAAYSEQLEALKEEFDTTALSSLKLTETPLVDFLRQNLILVTCPRSQMPDAKLVDPRVYDVIIDTVDIGLGKNCTFIPSAGTFSTASPNWNV